MTSSSDELGKPVTQSDANEYPLPPRSDEGVDRRKFLEASGALGVSATVGAFGPAHGADTSVTRTAKMTIKPYSGPSGGWGSLRSVAAELYRDGAPIKSSYVLWNQNKPHGFQCVSCAWAKPADYHPFEFCENGAKATAWEMTSAKNWR